MRDPVTKILIVDDSSFQRGIVGGILRGEGFSVITAGNGKEGIETALKESPDLLLLDLLMPEFDGYYFLREAKALGLKAPVLILTSDIQDTTRDLCLGMGAAGLVNKPVKRDTLLSSIRAILPGER